MFWGLFPGKQRQGQGGGEGRFQTVQTRIGEGNRRETVESGVVGNVSKKSRMWRVWERTDDRQGDSRLGCSQ